MHIRGEAAIEREWDEKAHTGHCYTQSDQEEKYKTIRNFHRNKQFLFSRTEIKSWKAGDKPIQGAAEEGGRLAHFFLELGQWNELKRNWTGIIFLNYKSDNRWIKHANELKNSGFFDWIGVYKLGELEKIKKDMNILFRG